MDFLITTFIVVVFGLTVLILTIENDTCCWIHKEDKKLGWVSSLEINGSCGQQIDVTLKIQCKKDLIRRPSDRELSRLCGLIGDGINKYWSRTVQREGQDWIVTVNVVEASTGKRKGIVVQSLHSEPAIQSTSRSHNSGILPMTMIYLQYKGLAIADLYFRRTAGHEIGHTFLHVSKGLYYSWTHKGSSTFFQNTFDKTESYPITGEIDLMKYYTGSYPSDYYRRVIVAEEDLLILLGLSYNITKRTC